MDQLVGLATGNPGKKTHEVACLYFHKKDVKTNLVVLNILSYCLEHSGTILLTMSGADSCLWTMRRKQNAE